MAKYWTSGYSGKTYDVTSKDAAGNWEEVDGPLWGSLSALALYASAMGGLFLIIGLAIALGTSFIFVAFTMAVARWFVTPMILTLVSLALLALPEGRRRWYVPAGAAVFSLFVLLPGTFISMFLLGHGYYVVGPQYAWAASIPLVPAMFLIISVWLAIRRSWWVMALSLVMAVATGLMSLMAWAWSLSENNYFTGPVPPARGSMAMDNILSLLTYGVVLAILLVVARQVTVSLERRRRLADSFDAVGQA